jgi:phage-related baseplate assembly protein
MSRIGSIELDQLPEMKVLEDLDSEVLIQTRLQKFVEVWKSYDPPAGADYDVANLEFDPMVILQEANAYFELLLRDRVNQAAKAVTLAFASGSDLDAIASRYPGGVPRQTNETDASYRTRIWLSPNTLSPHGIYESYVFWALTAEPTLRDATATAVKRGTPDVQITIMAEGTPVALGSDNKSITTFPDPTPTTAAINIVRDYVLQDGRRALTDVVYVRAPKIVYIDYVIKYWLFPSWNQASMDKQLWTALAALIEKQRWLGYSHTHAAVEAALMRSGVYNVVVESPAADTVIDKHEIVFVRSAKLIFAGRGGFEEATEPE